MIQARISTELASALDTRAASRGITRSDCVRELLEGAKEESGGLKTFRLQEPKGSVVLDVDQIITIETDYVYSRVTIRGGQSFKLWEEPERLAAQLGFYLQFGDRWIHPDAVSAVGMGPAGSVVHLADGRSLEVPGSWEAVSQAVDEARRLHGTPVPPPKPDLGGRLRRRHGSSGN